MTDDEKKLNATYIISVARKLGCSIFLLPEDIMEVRRMHQTRWIEDASNKMDLFRSSFFFFFNASMQIQRFIPSF